MAAQVNQPLDAQSDVAIREEIEWKTEQLVLNLLLCSEH